VKHLNKVYTFQIYKLFLINIYRWFTKQNYSRVTNYVQGCGSLNRRVRNWVEKVSTVRLQPLECTGKLQIESKSKEERRIGEKLKVNI